MKQLRRGMSCAFLSLAIFTWTSDVRAQNGPWKINVKDVEIASFIEEVATITGKTFVVDPRVKGTASIISDTELSQDGVYELLLSVLKIQEFSVIESGDVVEVIQSSRARTLAGAKEAIDAATSADFWVTHVLDAGHLDPAEIVKSLRQLAPQHAQFSAIAESNAVLISDRKNNVEAMLRVVEQLKSAATQKTVVVNLKHTLNSEVVELLKALLEGDESLNIIGNDKNNTLLLRGTDSALMNALQSIDLIDQPSENNVNTRVFRLGQSIAKDVAAIVSEIVREGPTQTESNSVGDRQTRIVADESLNAVVVKANPANMQRIASLIEGLDQRRTQVLIEAAIVEVDLTDVSSSGVELAAADEDGDTIPAFSTSLNGVLSALITRLGVSDTSADGINPVDVIGGLSSPTIAISQLDPDGFSFGAIINALTTTTYANLLSTPSVVALNNEESRILVGQNVPFRSGNLIFPNEQSLSGIRPTSRNDIGTELAVTPSIHEDLSVRMQIKSTIEVIQDTGLGIGETGLADIVTNKRELETVVVAENEQTIVLGGLIRTEARVTERRVPLLGNVPLIGRLFRSENQTNGRTMLLIFLRPTVMADADDAQSVTDRKYQEYWEVTIDRREQDQPAIDDLFKGDAN
ncbi:MAG: type II secretion system secretin GspD [Gammaproteobacteria bacterium]|nr:type II secretion system secretin GspD [Gammaproteobacteria bacterium]